MRDWGNAYRELARSKEQQLREARARGETHFRLGVTSLRPRAMSDRQIEDAARHDAERIVNRAIIEHNEQAERKGTA